MSDELRSAAKRLLLGPRAYRGTGHSARLDIQGLADAYLAEHQADDEQPIDLKWLDCLSRDGGDLPFICVTYRDGAYHLTGHSEYVAPDPATRGDVRRLCKSLGVELKEQP